MRRVLCALAVLRVLASGCSGGEPDAAVAAMPSPVATPTPAPDAMEPAPLAPLTGLPTDEAALDRPVLAVKIDNAPAARPQEGLELADVVFTELVEGGTTRFLALYQSRDPGDVGPVRSGREVDAVLLPAFRPVVALSGAARAVLVDFRKAGLPTFQEGESEAFHRRSDRSVPHNLFLTAAPLWAAGDAQPLDEPVWPHAAEAPAGGEPVSKVELAFSRDHDAAWRWEAAGGRWLRAQDGQEQVAASGDPIAASTVVVARVDVRPGRRSDAAGNRTVDIDVVGEGDAVVLRDGAAYEARWRKRSADVHFEWLDAAGQPLALAPGQTWVELVPSDQPLTRTGATDGP